jgi:hypothetical protein
MSWIDLPIRQAKDDKAEFEVVAWGAFTVGALADGSMTKLERDLSKVAGAPAHWRAR